MPVTNVIIVPDLTPAQNRGLRLIAGGLAAVLAVAAAVAGELWSHSATGAPGVLAGAVCSGCAAVAGLALAAGPARWQRPLVSSWRRIAAQMRSAPPATDIRTGVGLASIGAVSLTLIVARSLALSQNPWDDDQGAFLITAQEIHDRGGLTALWSSLWDGSFPEANRHPLYLAMLSLWPTVGGGEVLSATLGALTFVVLTTVAARTLGWPVAGVFGVLLGTNAAFCLFSTRIVCEVLLVLLCGLAWLAHVRPIDAPHRAVITGPRCAAAGALLGLAWLTKGTGLVLFGAYVVWLMIAAWRASGDGSTMHTRSRAARLCMVGWPVVIAGSAFLLVGSPLIARNVQRFGNPFHNLNSLLLFADRYEDLPAMVERGLSTGDAAREYMQTHSAGDMVRREATGLAWEAFIIVRSLGPAPLDDARVLFGLPVVLLAAAGMAVRRRPADGLLLAWTTVSGVMFAWYVPIAAGERFILPLLAPLLVAASEVLVLLIGQSLPGARRWWWRAAAVWSVVWVLACWLSSGFVDRNG